MGGFKHQERHCPCHTNCCQRSHTRSDNIVAAEMDALAERLDIVEKKVRRMCKSASHARIKRDVMISTDPNLQHTRLRDCYILTCVTHTHKHAQVDEHDSRLARLEQELLQAATKQEASSCLASFLKEW